MIWASIILGIIIIFYFFILLFNLISFIDRNDTFCILNDVFFYSSLAIAAICVLLDVSLVKKDTILILIGIVLTIPIRYIIITHFSNYFSNTFGYNMIEVKADKLFYKLVNRLSNDDDTLLNKIYSKYGPMINNIHDFIPNGLHRDNKKSSKYRQLFLDYEFTDKKDSVINYLNKVLDNDVSVSDSINEILDLLDKKYLTAKSIWTVIMIIIVFCFSLQYI